MLIEAVAYSSDQGIPKTYAELAEMRRLHSFQFAAADVIEHRHPHRYAVLHLFQNPGLFTVNHMEDISTPRLIGPGMHDHGIRLGQLEICPD